MKNKVAAKDNYKLAYFGQKHSFSREGGVEIVVAELATRMAELGYDVTCIDRRGHHVSGKEFDQKEMTEYKGVKIVSVPTIERKGLAAASSAFWATLKAALGNFDIVHIHAEGPAAFCWILKLFHKRVILTCHGLDWDRPRWRNSFGGKFIKYGEKMAVRYADAIIVLSKAVEEYFKKTYGCDTVYIPNGVNKPEIIQANIIKDKWSLSENSYFLTLSRLTREKRTDLLIEAFKEVQTDKKLVIAGGSSDSDGYVRMLHDLAKNDSRIIFTGFVQGQEMEELYSNAYVYCLPSELEGMPLSLLEAMSYGNCCLTSDIPECTDVIGKKGLSFVTNNEEDLIRTLQELADAPEKVREYKREAADYVCSKYNWNDVVERTLELYRGNRDD